MIIIIFSIIFLALDQLSKVLITNLFTANNSLTIIKDFFYLTYAHNKGAAFSILNDKRIFLIIIAILVIGAIIYYLKKNKVKNKMEMIAFSLIIGGSLGNLIDRIMRGYVIDFLDFKIFSYDFPIFNLADTFIVIGVSLLIIMSLRKEEKHGNR